MRLLFRIPLVALLSTVCWWWAYALAAPAWLPILIAGAGGALLAYMVELLQRGWVEAMTPARRHERRLARDVERAVQRRRQQTEMAKAKDVAGGGT